jgi:hypothetical protein
MLRLKIQVVKIASFPVILRAGALLETTPSVKLSVASEPV